MISSQNDYSCDILFTHTIENETLTRETKEKILLQVLRYERLGCEDIIKEKK